MSENACKINELLWGAQESTKFQSADLSISPAFTVSKVEASEIEFPNSLIDLAIRIFNLQESLSEDKISNIREISELQELKDRFDGCLQSFICEDSEESSKFLDLYKRIVVQQCKNASAREQVGSGNKSIKIITRKELVFYIINLCR